jgi:hypothetical protein
MDIDSSTKDLTSLQTTITEQEGPNLQEIILFFMLTFLYPTEKASISLKSIPTETTPHFLDTHRNGGVSIFSIAALGYDFSDGFGVCLVSPCLCLVSWRVCLSIFSGAGQVHTR